MAKYKVIADVMLEAIMPVFKRTINEDFNKIRSSIETSDFNNLKGIGHKIKGNAGGYGFDDLGDMARALEQYAIGADLEKVKETFALMDDYMKNVEIEYVDEE